MAQVGQPVKPDKIERKVNEEIGKGGKIPFSTLVIELMERGLPFLI